MGRYELDRLGHYQFEWLIQVLLKAKFGFAIEAWGGHGDYGRDAYSRKAITSADKSDTFPGPVVFQAKFVSGANAAGAKPNSALASACTKEASRIEERKNNGTWAHPATYFLLTNAPLNQSTRQAVEAALRPVLGFEPLMLGFHDICAELDKNPHIARSFPQILSFDNLLHILDRSVSDAVNRDIIARTEAVLSKAKEVLPVFVPTAAFDECWRILLKHHFAVLTGPPEMGKTSISWMIAFVHLANGWQVIDCESPDDFFRLYQTDKRQIFLADDAFGRTEYIGEIGKRWERQIGNIVHRLDNHHVLIWTSRKHILQRALIKMDLGSSVSFPKPAEVIVQADDLSRREKALILYRHAVASSLEEEAKALLKRYVGQIITDAHFTPLRIALFCKKSLPEIAKMHRDGTLPSGKVSQEIAKSIREATSEMVKTYKALPLECQWLLTILLDETNVRTIEDIAKIYKERSPIPLTRPVEEMLDELDESFVRLGRERVYVA